MSKGIDRYSLSRKHVANTIVYTNKKSKNITTSTQEESSGTSTPKDITQASAWKRERWAAMPQSKSIPTFSRSALSFHIAHSSYQPSTIYILCSLPKKEHEPPLSKVDQHTVREFTRKNPFLRTLCRYTSGILQCFYGGVHLCFCAGVPIARRESNGLMMWRRADALCHNFILDLSVVDRRKFIAQIL